MFCLLERFRLNLNNKENLTTIKVLNDAIDQTPMAGKLNSNLNNKNDLIRNQICFADIGGLNKIKKKLIEIFCWPILVGLFF